MKRNRASRIDGYGGLAMLGVALLLAVADAAQPKKDVDLTGPNVCTYEEE